MAKRGGNVKISRDLSPPESTGKHHRLLCMTGENKGACYFILSKRIVLGRGENVDIRVLDNQSSREHLEIVLVGEKYILTDLNSQNGVIVNDLKVKQHTLKDMDKFIIGQTVYKYNYFDVISPFDLKKIEKEEELIDKEENENKKPAKRKSLLYGIIILLAIFLFWDSDEKISKKEEKVKAPILTENDKFLESLLKKQKEKDKEIDDEFVSIIHRGLREFRERNYYRAIEEFNLALRINPGDGRANFYLNRTKQRLDEEIDENFLRGRQSEDALKYQEAMIAYCAILKLIRTHPDDERYIKSEKNIKNLEQKMGLDEGDFECIVKESNR